MGTIAAVESSETMHPRVCKTLSKVEKALRSVPGMYQEYPYPHCYALVVALLELLEPPLQISAWIGTNDSQLLDKDFCVKCASTG